MDKYKISDSILIKDFQNGNEQAFNEIVNRYKDKLNTYVFYFVNDTDLSEDIVQDTFLILWKKKHTYKEIAKFSTWLYTIAGNLARSELRKRKRRGTLNFSEISEKEFVIEDVKEDTSEQEYLSKQVYKTLNTLESDTRNIIILRDIQELSYADISIILNLPIGTVKSRINRARLKLKSKIFK